MKCWELTSLSSNSPLLYTPRIPQTDQFSSLYIPLFDPTATAYPEFAAWACTCCGQQSIFRLPTTAWRYWHIEVRCRVVVISQGLQAICRRSLDDRSAQSRYRWWSQEWGWWCSRTWSWGLRSTDLFTSIRKVLSLGRGDWPGLCSSSSPRVRETVGQKKNSPILVWFSTSWGLKISDPPGIPGVFSSSCSLSSSNTSMQYPSGAGIRWIFAKSVLAARAIARRLRKPTIPHSCVRTMKGEESILVIDARGNLEYTEVAIGWDHILTMVTNNSICSTAAPRTMRISDFILTSTKEKKRDPPDNHRIEATARYYFKVQVAQ